MKFGITRNEGEDADKKPYKLWFRTSDGSLKRCPASGREQIRHIVELFAEQEGQIQMAQTQEQTKKDDFLEKL